MKQLPHHCVHRNRKTAVLKRNTLMKQLPHHRVHRNRKTAVLKRNTLIKQMPHHRVHRNRKTAVLKRNTPMCTKLKKVWQTTICKSTHDNQETWCFLHTTWVSGWSRQNFIFKKKPRQVNMNLKSQNLMIAVIIADGSHAWFQLCSLNRKQ